MHTAYAWQDVPAGGTRMTLRNTGEAIWLRHVAAPVMAAAMRRTHAKELHLLKETIERPCDR